MQDIANLGNASGVEGSGTINRLAKFTASSTIGNSQLFDDGTSVGLGTITPLGLLHLFKASATTRMVMDGNASQSKIITYRTNGVQRFGLYVNNTAESGSNVGSDFQIRAYSDAGTLLSTPLFIKRSNGNVGIDSINPITKLDIVGSSSTEFGALRLYNLDGNGGTQNSVSLLMQVRNSINNLPSVKLIAQEATTDSNLGELIIQTSNDESATLSEVVRIAQNGAGGSRFIRMASGTGGIQFNGDTASANALDDYEEGTWTMGVSFGNGSTGITYSDNTGTYTKIGRKVTVNGLLQLSSKGTDAGVARLTGLPFAIGGSSQYSALCPVHLENITFAGQYQLIGAIGDTVIVCQFVTELGVNNNMSNVNFSNTSRISINFTYFV